MLALVKTRTGKIALVLALAVVATVFIVGLLPERLRIPVRGATTADWNHHTFWHPWGKSGVHKGIDIFAREGTPVIASCSGWVVYQGAFGDGGNVVLILGRKWRLHYYAHLKTIHVRLGGFVREDQVIGAVGTTGNAAGKPPHLHYSIVRLIPDIFQFRWDRHGIDRMYYLNPHEQLIHP